jgi:hypothetical protein
MKHIGYVLILLAIYFTQHRGQKGWGDIYTLDLACSVLIVVGVALVWIGCSKSK